MATPDRIVMWINEHPKIFLSTRPQASYWYRQLRKGPKSREPLENTILREDPKNPDLFDYKVYSSASLQMRVPNYQALPSV